jgi:WD40 repeat protein
VNEQALARNFSLDVDRILQRRRPEPPADAPTEYRQSLETARRLAEGVFPLEREAELELRRRVLEEIPANITGSTQLPFAMPGFAYRQIRLVVLILALLALVLVGWILSGGLSDRDPLPVLPTEEPEESPAVQTVLSFPAGQLGRLAYVQDGNIWVKAMPWGEAHRLTHTGDNHSPRWSPSSKWLVYRSGENEAWLASQIGEPPQALGGGGQVGILAWSPRADRLAYTVNGFEVRLIDPGTGEDRLLLPAKDDRQALNMVWRPNGWDLAVHLFELLPGGQRPYSAIFSLSSFDGSLSEGDLASGNLYLYGWSSDGQALIFWDGLQDLPPESDYLRAPSLEASSLVLLSLEDYRPRVLTDATPIQPDFVSQSPDPGQILAVLTGSGDRTWTGRRLALVEPGGSEEISPEGQNTLWPAWSPDGKRLAYTAGPDPGLTGDSEAVRRAWMARRIWVNGLDGEDPLQLAGDPAFSDERPLWSVDGEWIVFVRTDVEGRVSLWIVPSQGGDPQRIADDLDLPPLVRGQTGPEELVELFGLRDWSAVYDWGQTAPRQIAFLGPTATPTVGLIPDPPDTPPVQLGAGRIQSRVVSPAGDLLAVGTIDAVHLYRLSDMQEVWRRTVGSARDRVNYHHLAFNREGTQLAAGIENYFVFGWETATGNPVFSIRSTGSNIPVFSPDGKQILIGGGWDGSLSLWDLETSARLKRYPEIWTHRAVPNWTSDGRLFAAYTGYNQAGVIDAASGERLFDYILPENQMLDSLAWVQEGRILAVGGGSEIQDCSDEVCIPIYSGLLVLLDAQTEEVLRFDEYDQRVNRLEVSPDRGSLAVGFGVWHLDQHVIIYDLDSMTPTARLDGVRPDLWMSWLPDGETLLVAHDQVSFIEWKPVSGETSRKTLSDFVLSPTSLAWSPDGGRLATTNYDGRTTVWEIPSGAPILTLPTERAGQVAWSPDGAYLAIAPEFSIWEVASGEVVARIPFDEQNWGWVMSLAWTDTGDRSRLIALSSIEDKVLATVWEAGQWDSPTSFEAGLSYEASISPDGRLLAVSDPELHSIRLWDIEQQAEASRLTMGDRINYLTWSKEGRRLAGTLSDKPFVWDFERMVNLLSDEILPGQDPSDMWYNRFVLSPSGNLLASVGNRVHIYEVDTSGLVFNLGMFGDSVQGLAFSPDDEHLAVLGYEGKLLVWRLYPSGLEQPGNLINP